MDRVTGDYLGMLATIMNAISMQDALEQEGCETRTLSALTITQIAEPYIRRRALRHLDKNRIVIVSGGTGNPFFTTDSAAALRAKELNAEIVIKGTKVDGVYDKDPNAYADAKLLKSIDYDYCLDHQLDILDLSAFSQAKAHNLALHIASFKEPEVLLRLVNGGSVGTKISNDGTNT